MLKKNPNQQINTKKGVTMRGIRRVSRMELIMDSANPLQVFFIKSNLLVKETKCSAVH